MQHPDEGTIHAWIDDALSPAEARALESHLGVCDDCARAAAEARGLVAASSRILMALDDVPGGVVPMVPPVNTPVVAPSTDVTPIQRGAVRRWHTPFWMRTAAAVVVIAGTSALIMTAKLNNVKTADVAALAVDTAGQDLALQSDAATSESTGIVVQSAPAEAPVSARLPAVRAPAPAPTAPQRVVGTAAGAAAGSVRASMPSSARGDAAALAGTGSATNASSAPPTVAGDARPGSPDSRIATTSALMTERSVPDRAVAAREESKRQAVADAQANAAARDYARERSAGAAPAAAAASAPVLQPLHADTGRLTNTPSTTSGMMGAIRAGVSKAKGSESAPSGAPTRALGSFSADREWLSSSGCYALTMSPWSGGSIPFGSPPPKIELDTLRSELGDLLVHPGRGAAPNGARHAYWTQRGDSVYVTWTGEGRGVMLTLPASGNVRRGRAETIGAEGRGGAAAQSSNVEARRISCRE